MEEKYIAEVKNPTTGETVIFEGDSEKEIIRQVDEYFENN